MVLLSIGLLASACGSDASFTADVQPDEPTASTPAASPSPTAAPVDDAPSEVVPAEPAPDQEFAVAERIEFAAGSTTGTKSGAVILGQRDRYTLGAAAGQTMNVSITSLEDNAVFDLVGPEGAPLDTEVTTSTVTLPLDGDYVVVVGGTRGNATYELVVSITSP